ncbi:hypothetical protein BOTBODRAFT_192744 [Botryobasidium botryosum FD-172 SS1]|uniref:Glucose-6-phosphate 1-epimerase n=1 Tax=Botryobasidium botryosum (strain FD-172 SS1) TaxID=930990 RepID=A0A067M4Y1_BOTB1|nr:hypothetical protein BOTBODRAFT_192744 [Botryobasidium botryosum FD-172 SS1]
MPIERNAEKITLSLPSAGASAEILFFGATVISWKSAGASGNSDPTERLFLSKKSALDGSKPVRGGIPVVFPFFGAPTDPAHMKMSSHGFARSSTWEWGGEVLDNESGVSVRLKLNPTPEISQVFSPEFSLTYVVTLAAHQLSTDLHVHNPSSDTALTHQALLHTYISTAPHSSTTVSVTPLKGLTYFDKVAGTTKQEEREKVDVKEFTDSVYRGAGSGERPDGGQYKVRWGPEGAETGLDVRATNFGDVVVWNPREEAGSKLGDMEVGGWDRFVCVEPGIASYWNTIAPGEKWIGQQVLTAI